jgi:hypothetical protein
MNSSPLKVVIPIALLMAVIFAVTYFSQYTPTEPETKEVDKAGIKKPLQFFSNVRRWDPSPGASLQDREFPGFFELGENHYTASFWFENRNPSPVTLNLQRVSCTACSGGRVAAIPAAVTSQILQMTAISILPQGLVSMLPAGLALPTAQLDSKRSTLVWQSHTFDKPLPEVVYTIPPAPTSDRWSAQWGILELNFKAKPGGRPLTADFLASTEGADEPAEERFAIIYQAADPLIVDTASIDVGELTDGSASQTHEVLIYSTTRKPADVPQMDVLVMMPPGVGGEPGEFISAGALQPVPEKELESLQIRVSLAAKYPTRVQSAFRLPVVVRVQVGNAKLDIGKVERVIAITPQGTETKQVHVRGTMRGPFYLAGARAIDFGAFASANEQVASVDVETDRTGIELAIVKELTQPKSLKLELKKLPDNGDRGFYRLRATLPGNSQIGEIRDGVVVLESKGQIPQRLRIPVVGRGR